MDVMGDFGGCTEIIVIFFGIILNLISEFSFKLKALKKLYKVKSNSTKMFKNDEAQLKK